MKCEQIRSLSFFSVFLFLCFCSSILFAGEKFSLNDFVLYAEKEIKLKKISDSVGRVGSNKSIHIKKGKCGTLQGDLRALGKIKNDAEITIAGDVFTNKKVDDKGTLTVLGSVVENANLSKLTLPAFSFSAGGSNIDVSKNAAKTLDPGSYGKVKLKDHAELHLSSGDYYIKEFHAHHNAAILIDLSKGPIFINVEKKLHVDKYFEIRIDPLESGTTKDIFINIREKKNVTIKKGSIVRGTIVAPNAEVKFKDGCQLEGAVYAKKISIDKDVRIRYHDSIPENRPPVADAGIVQTVYAGNMVFLEGGSSWIRMAMQSPLAGPLHQYLTAVQRFCLSPRLRVLLL